jgi:hypothetical protein
MGGRVVREPVTPERDEPARWFDHWEDGASREDAGLREDAEMQRRDADYR